jgi:hypothetical protein
MHIVNTILNLQAACFRAHSVVNTVRIHIQASLAGNISPRYLIVIDTKIVFLKTLVLIQAC